MRRYTRPVLVAAAFALAAMAQAPNLAPSSTSLHFDAASIKPSIDMAQLQQLAASGKMPAVGTHVDSGRVTIGFTSLRDLICSAYKLKTYQVIGPDWLNSTRFDIQATFPAGATEAQLPDMFQNLLIDRFGMTSHKDTKDMEAMVLLVGKDGPKLQPAEADQPEAPATPAAKGEQTIDTGQGQMRVKQGANGSTSMSMAGGRNGPMNMTMSGGVMHMELGRVSMDEFAQSLTQFLGQPVIDQTKLAGNYKIVLDISQDDLMAVARAAMASAGVAAPPGMPAASNDPSGNSVYASVAKLGLKLDHQKAPVPTLVIDHISQTPTGN